MAGPQQLLTTLTFTNLAAGATSVQAHSLNQGANAVVPDLVFCPQQGVTVTADATNVTVTNNAAVAQTVQVFCWRVHTVPRALAPGLTAMTPQPLVLLGASATQPAFPDVLSGTNRSALINAAIATQAALYAIDGVVRQVTLGAGTYVLTAGVPLALLSGVELVGMGRGVTVIDTSLITGTPDDPLNYGIGAVGVLDPATLNTTLASIITKGGNTVNLTAAGTLAANQFVAIDGRNATSNSYSDTDGTAVVLFEVLPVTSVVGVAVTFTRRAWQYHAAGVRARRITPVQHVALRRLSLRGGAQSAVGFLARSCIDVTIEDVGGFNYSRTICDFDNGTSQYVVNGLHDEGTCNSSLYLDSVFGGLVMRLTTDPAGARFNALGVQRGCLHTRNRTTGLVVDNCVLTGRCCGINTWGLRHAQFANIHVRDMDGTQALATGGAAGEISGGLFGAGISGNTTAIPTYGEYILDTHWVNIEIHDIIPGGANAAWWMTDDYHDSTFTNIGIYNDSGAVGALCWVNDDVFNCSFRNVKFRGVQSGFYFIGQSPSGGCTYEDCYMIGNCADNPGTATNILFNFFAATGAPAGTPALNGTGARFIRCSVGNVNATYWLSMAGGLADYSFAFYDCVFSSGGLAVGYAVPALNNAGVALNIGDLVQLDPASAAGIRAVIGSGGAPNTRNAVVVVGAPVELSAAGQIVLVAPLPQAEAFVRCDAAAVNVGDLLVASGTAQQATPNAAPAAYTACGRAQQLKAAGASGIVPITNA